VESCILMVIDLENGIGFRGMKDLEDMGNSRNW
jgi:hypothetical protein